MTKAKWRTKYPMVLIDWWDSKGITGDWEFWEDIKPMGPSKCLTVGYLIDSTDEYRTLALCISKDQVLGQITIPVSAIHRETALILDTPGSQALE